MYYFLAHVSLINQVNISTQTTHENATPSQALETCSCSHHPTSPLLARLCSIQTARSAYMTGQPRLLDSSVHSRSFCQNPTNMASWLPQARLKWLWVIWVSQSGPVEPLESLERRRAGRVASKTKYLLSSRVQITRERKRHESGECEMGIR